MLEKFHTAFIGLPLSNRSMVYLSWIYSAWVLIATLFVNIYIYKITQSIIWNIVYTGLFYCFTLVWFSGMWYIMSCFRWNVTNLYYFWYGLFIISFLILLFWWQNGEIVYTFAAIYGLWNWLFWCALHTQELKNILDENRDFYSSSVSSWKNVLEIFVPLFIWIAFYFWEMYKFSAYKLLFWILPFIYLSSIIFIKNIDSYSPHKVLTKDILYFFWIRRHVFSHLYYIFSWFVQSIGVVIIAVVSITLLKNEMNIWLFQAWLWVLSTLVIMKLWLVRRPENRIVYIWSIIILTVINLWILVINFSTIWFVAYSLLWLFIIPLLKISMHVYDLKIMDSIRYKGSDFFPSMILRETVLFCWRLFWLLLIVFLYSFFEFSQGSFLRIWLFILGIFLIFLYVSLYYWEKYQKKDN
jgi:hypothetical protein